MKNKEFFNLDHAVAYMTECVIMFNGEPIYITGVDRGRHKKNFTLNFINLGQDGYKSILSDNSGVDMNPVPLGFNSSLEAIVKGQGTRITDLGYMSRMPARRWKIGLTTRSLTINDAKPRSSYTTARDHGTNGYINSISLRNTILNKYPTYEQSYKTSQDMPGLGIAFSRRFAIDKDHLYYKTFNVPVGKPTKNNVVLDDDFGFLKEILAEDMKYANR